MGHNKSRQDRARARAPQTQQQNVAAVRADIAGDKKSLEEHFGIRGTPFVETAKDSESKANPHVGKIPSFIPRELPIDPSQVEATQQVTNVATSKSGHPLPPFVVPNDTPLPELSPEQLKFIRGMQEVELEGDEIDRNFNFLEGKSGADVIGDGPGSPKFNAKPTASVDASTTQLPKKSSTQTTTPEEKAYAQLLPSAPVRHPVLQQMLAAFGLERLVEKSETVGGFKFGFRGSNTVDQALAIRYAGLRSASGPEFEMYKSIMLMAICVTSINDTPAYEVFNENLTDSEREAVKRSPTNPPETVVTKIAPKAIMFLLENIEPTILDDLAKAYTWLYRDEIESHRGHTAEYLHEAWRFECLVDGCDEIQERIPHITDPVKGYIEPVFCPIHGKPMRPVSTLEDFRNNPLG